ncbi:MAG: PIN domain-containing protein, partial [Gemmatimonadales bacterium]
FVDTVAGLGFDPLDITAAAAQRAGGWTVTHKDPFDRMLAAQAEIEGVPLITNDDAFPPFGVATVW